MVEHGEGEPTFVLTSDDIVAPDTVRAWAAMAQRGGADERLVRRAMEVADQMEAWARRHGHHVPGKPTPAPAEPLALDIRRDPARSRRWTDRW